MDNKDDEFFNRLEQNAVLINLQNTIDFLNNLHKKKGGFIVSNYPTINGVPISIYKSDRLFKFNSQALSRADSRVQPYLYQREMYGYSQPFLINNYDDVLLLNHGAYNTVITLSADLAEGDISQINNRKDDEVKYYRCIQPLRGGAKVPEDYICSKAFKTDRFLRYGGYITITVENILISIYNCSINDKKQIIVDALSKVSFDVFENIVEVIAECFALISGSSNRDERIIVGSNDVNFTSIKNFTFSRLDDSVISRAVLV